MALDGTDDSAKSKGHKSKRPPVATTTGSASRTPTPEGGKGKHEGSLRERLEAGELGSLGLDDIELLLESLKDQERAQSRETEEAKRRKSDDEKVKSANDENLALRRTVEELEEKERRTIALHESKLDSHAEESAQWTREWANLEARHQVEVGRINQSIAVERKNLDEERAGLDANRAELHRMGETLKHTERVVSTKNEILNQFQEEQQGYYMKWDKQRLELDDAEHRLSSCQTRLKLSEATEEQMSQQLQGSRERESSLIGEARKNTVAIQQMREEADSAKLGLQQEQILAESFKQSSLKNSLVARQEETRALNLTEELTSEQLAYREYTQAVEADVNVNYAQLVKSRDRQINQMAQKHQQEIFVLTNNII